MTKEDKLGWFLIIPGAVLWLPAIWVLPEKWALTVVSLWGVISMLALGFWALARREAVAKRKSAQIFDMSQDVTGIPSSVDNAMNRLVRPRVTMETHNALRDVVLKLHERQRALEAEFRELSHTALGRPRRRHREIFAVNSELSKLSDMLTAEATKVYERVLSDIDAGVRT
jgi:hypothetical protein